MSDPVKLKVSGKIFDRQSILGWFEICRASPRCPLTKLPVTERPFEEALTFDEDTQRIIEGTLNLGTIHGYKILETNDKVNIERFQRIGKFNDLTIQVLEQLNTKTGEGKIEQQVICPITNKIITRPVSFKGSSIIFDASSIDNLISQSLSKEADPLEVVINGESIYTSPEGLSKEESLQEFVDGIQTNVQSLITIGMKVQKLVKKFIAENQYGQTQTMAFSLQRAATQLGRTATNTGASTAGLFANQLSASLSDPIMEPAIQPLQEAQEEQVGANHQYSNNNEESDVEADNANQSRI